MLLASIGAHFPVYLAAPQPVFSLYTDTAFRMCRKYGANRRVLTQPLGMRALVGKVSMDRNSPDTYVEASSLAATRDARAFVEGVLEKGGDLVTPIVTPRFVRGGPGGNLNPRK